MNQRHSLPPIIFVFLTFISLNVFSESLKPVEFKNQFDESTQFNKDTQWILFSRDKNVSNLINKQLESLKITDLSSLKGLYVADVSKMPSLVMSMFALPKMKKYPFKVALDRDGNETKSWPYKEGSATLMKLKELLVIEVIHLSTEGEIESQLKELSQLAPNK